MRVNSLPALALAGLLLVAARAPAVEDRPALPDVVRVGIDESFPPHQFVEKG